MATTCRHLDQVVEVDPGADGSEECRATGGRWVHLRVCMSCGHVGCCDGSPGRHATRHHRQTTHPLIRSFEPGEDWWWCYPHDLAFEIDGSAPAPSHP